MTEPEPIDLDFRLRQDNGFVVVVQSAIYSRDVVMRAMHGLTDRAHVHLSESEEHLTCRVVAKRPVDNGHYLAGEFANSLLDHALRERLAAQTEGIRQVLAAHVFSKADLLRPDLASTDPEEDPEAIATPDRLRDEAPAE